MGIPYYYEKKENCHEAHAPANVATFESETQMR
jgi:hypothetical protein